MAHHPSITRWLAPAGTAFLLTLSPWWLEGGPLPRLAVSLPPGVTITEVVRTVQACGTGDVLVVLPAARFRIGGEPAPAGAASPIAAPSPLPQGTDVYLHVVVEIGAVAGVGRDRETAVEQRVAEFLRLLALDVHPVKGLVVEVASEGPSPELFQFTLATLVVMAKGARPGLQVVVMPSARALADLPEPTRRIAAYADSLAFAGKAVARDSRIADLSMGKPFMLRFSAEPGERPGGAARTLLDALVTSPTPAADIMWIDVPTLADLRLLCTSVQFLTRSLAGGFEMTSPERAPAAILVEGKPAMPAVAFVGSQTADVAVLLRASASREAPRLLDLAQAKSKAPQLSCFDALDGRSLPVHGAQTSSPGCNADSEYVFVRVAHGGGEERLFEAVSVKGRADLRVEEIIARWQAAREVERRLLLNYSVSGLLGMHFEAGGTLGVAFDVALELEKFVDSSGLQEWVQKGFFINGVRFRKGTEFPLPMLEPDKVVTRPLELSLDEKYDYRLLGTDTVDGTLCYVVGIEPTRTDETLYAGKVWIDGLTFRQVRLQLEQRTGKNNVAAHIETQDFGLVRDAAGRDFMLLRSIRAQDTINLGGRSVILEKHYRFEGYAINTADFAARLAAAQASNDPMYKDTEEGLRAYRKEGQVRVVKPLSGKRVSSLVGGMFYDGTFSFPVPLVGVSFINFAFRGTETQLSALFAGLFLELNLSRQWNKNLRTGVDVHLSALPGTDHVYSGDTELTDQQVRYFQQWVGGRVDWQATSDWNFTAATYASFTNYQRTSATSPQFTVPPNVFGLEFFGETKYTRRGFSVDATFDQFVRLGGGSYGYADGPGGTNSSPYRRYSAEVTQHFFAGRLRRVGIFAGYFGGDDLDRFARYKPSLMSRPKMRGIPSGSESLDEVSVLGAFYAFNVLDLLKLEATYRHAWTRNRDESNSFQQFDGCDLNIGITGPWSTYIQASAGVLLRGNLARYNSRWDMYVLVFKPLH